MSFKIIKGFSIFGQMNGLKDISSKADVTFLVESFYQKLINESSIGFFFTDVVPLDFELHLPKMINFWESILFGTASYKGNPMLKHLQLDFTHKIEDHHFAEWIKFWTETVRTHFSGDNAEKAIKKAVSISELIKYKLSQNRNFKIGV